MINPQGIICYSCSTRNRSQCRN